jgi:putative transposase
MERVRLYPSASQRAALAKMLDVTRQLYNAALEQRIAAYRRCRVMVSASMQYRELTSLRCEDVRIASVYREVEDSALRRLDLAFAAFFRRLRRGERAGFPRFRAVSRWDTLVFPHGDRALRLNADQSKVRVPGVGVVRLRNGRVIPAFGRAMISRRAGRFYALFECDCEASPLPQRGNVVGLDRGVVAVVATSEGELVAFPDCVAIRRRAVRVAQKRLSRRKRGSRRRGQARELLARAHERLANARRDFAHKLSRAIVDRYDTIVLERLNVRGMTRSARGTVDQPGSGVRAKSGLNREILHAGWSIFRKLIVEKAEKAVRTVVEVDAKNTSRECSSCGVVEANSRRSQSSFVCMACGYASNADVNAARVIVKRAELRPAGSLGALVPDADLQSALSSGRTRLKSQDAA